VFVGAPTSWANPWEADWSRYPGGRARAFARFEQLLAEYPVLVNRARHYLVGRDLACWCREDDPHCHGGLLLRVANDLGENT
jgi:hypothetical protein